MEGNRVVAGTICGDLHVWSVKDIFATVFSTYGGRRAKPTRKKDVHRGGEGVSAGSIGCPKRNATDFAAGS
jgi:hypothetical protein